ncbi:MAG: hypothetical protein JWL59_1213 [Chthoniobacteraceae bacterium]|nr:hypothetical protein [Chthoniobacteraceae bacterium]
MARREAGHFEIELSRATKISEMVALGLEKGGFDTEAKVESYLCEVLKRNREIFGSCLAFEPHGFNPEKRWYAPYYYWKDEQPEFVQLGNPGYDYFHWEWYWAPKESGTAHWSEPYFDEGGGNTIMTTYSVPFRRDGKFWGIATIDIAMSQLIERASRIQVGRTGYAFIVSKQGRFLAYADKGRIMKSSIQEVNPELGRRMISGEDGFLRTQDPSTGRDAWIAFVPVQNGELSLAVVYPESELMKEALRQQVELLVLGISGLMVMFAAVILVARSISRPIRELAIAAQEVAAGRLDYKLSPNNTTVDEVRHLTFAFNKMTRDLQMRMEELRYTTTITERLQGELSGARSIQMSLLPKIFPAFPDRPEIDIHALIRPAREVGGDFYDFYFVDEHRLCLTIGDVSGKGIGAALFMAVTKTLLKSKSSAADPIDVIMRQVNREICQGGDTGMFVTLIYALLDTSTGRLELCNAGHLPPLIVTGAAGEVTPVHCQAGIALGLMREADYPITHVQLAPGDTLVFFTDGITEALDPDRNFYAALRLRASIEGSQEMPVQMLTRNLAQDVRNFTAGREQADDIAILALRWKGMEVETQAISA